MWFFLVVVCTLAVPLGSLATGEPEDSSLVKITRVSGGNIGVLDCFKFDCSVVKDISTFSLSLMIDDNSKSDKYHRVSNISTHWNYSFSFGPILPSDNVTIFLCTVTFNGDVSSSHTLILDFEKPTAKISVQSKTSVLGLNDNFLFSCSVDDPHLELTLFVDNRSDSEMMKRINKTSAASGNMTAYNYTLMETLPTDNGTTFYCLASNKTFLNETYRTDTVLLQIKYAPLFAVANNETLNHFIKTGNNSLLNCSVSMSNPPLQSIKFSDTSKNTKNIKMNSTTGIISFTKSQVNNRGTYTCTASNSIGSTTLSYQTFIGGAPDKIQVSVKSTILNESIVIALGVNDSSDAPAQNITAKLNWISDPETINFGLNIPVENIYFSEVVNEELNDVFPGNYSLTVTANNVLGTYKVLEQTLFVPGLKSLEVDLVPVSEDVVEGDDYTFTCEANAENIHTDVSFVVLIDAKHSGNDFDRLIKGGSTPYSQNFTFVNTSYTDDKTIFTCVGNKLDESEDTEMGVLYGPTLAKAQTFIEKASKSNFNLTCTVARANPPVDKLTIEPHTGPNWVLKKNGTNSVYLEFTQADAKESSGQFVCHAANEISTANMTFNLYVGGAPNNVTILVHPTIINETLVIDLEVYDYSDAPAHSISITLEGLSDTKTINFGPDIPVKNLSLSNVIDEQLHDVYAGNYSLIVTATNDLGTQRVLDQSIFVAGLRSLDIELMSDSENVTEGSNYSFQCVADADNVTVNITFDVLIDNSTTGEKCKRLHRGTTEPTSQEFTFVDTLYTDDKTMFECVANTVYHSETTTMIVLYSPVITVPSQLGGYLMEELIVNISIEANPTQYTVQWLKNGKKLKSGDGVNVDKNVLTFCNLTNSDAGNYTITADNGIGKPSKRVFELIAFDGPYFEQGTPNTTVLFEGASSKDFNLTCTVTKAIPTINNLTIVPERGPNWKLKKNNKNSVSLIFTNANSQNNSRQFVCKATNNLTTSVLYFNTYVGGAPDNMKVEFQNHSNSSTITVSLKVTDNSSVPATKVVYFLEGVFKKNMTCNLPRKNLPLNGSSFVCENVVEQSFEDLTAGAEYILNVWGANDVGGKKLEHFTFRVPSPPRNKSKTSKGGAIAVGIIVPLAVIALIFVAMATFCYCKRRRSRRGFKILSSEDDSPTINSSGGGYATERVIT